MNIIKAWVLKSVALNLSMFLVSPSSRSYYIPSSPWLVLQSCTNVIFKTIIRPYKTGLSHYDVRNRLGVGNVLEDKIISEELDNICNEWTEIRFADFSKKLQTSDYT
jgi:hypothetical protein